MKDSRIMPTPRTARPANRPSRRHEILAAAIELLAVQPPDEIAVSDIAAQASMTPAAFYYHFSSKDEILDEIVTAIAADWGGVITDLLAHLDSPTQLADFMDTVLTWVDERERAATVYFVTSIGATSTCEAVRKRTRDDLTKKATKAFTVMSPAKDKVEIAVAGFALIALLESVARARLELDPSYRTLGPMRFRANAAALAEHLIQ
ncbi:MAG: HTH-type transcriptional regulator BetI [Actinomycetota bacterium]|jgi:AcrR family transcriptional regulator